MDTKSYTLADNSVVTISADENGVKVNDGLKALSKAINASLQVLANGGGSGHKFS